MAAFVVLLELLPGAGDGARLHLTLTAFWCLGVLLTPLFWFASRSRLARTSMIYRQLLPMSVVAKVSAEVAAPLLLSSVFLAGAAVHAVFSAFGAPGVVRSLVLFSGILVCAGIFSVLVVSLPSLTRDRRGLGVGLVSALLLAGTWMVFHPELLWYAFPLGFLDGAGFAWGSQIMCREPLKPGLLLGVLGIWSGIAAIAGMALVLTLSRGPRRT